MRTILLTLTFALAFTLSAASPEEQQILAAEKAWATAVMNKDFAKLEAMLMPDLIYAHSTGIIDDKAQYLQKMKAGKQNYAGIEHKSTTVHVYEPSAVAHSQVRMHGTNATGPFDDQLMMLHLWVKNKAGQWQLAAHQTTRLK